MEKIIKNLKNLTWIAIILVSLGAYNETQAFTCGTDTVVGRSPDTITYQTVLGADGNCWLKSNLGTANVATAYNDSSAYGWLYQWGRLTDGHQITTSGTTPTNATTDTPGHANFITEETSPWDWRVPQNNNLWQGVNGINNPCPVGWRLPTSAEWGIEVTAAGITNYTTAFNSSLKLTAAGWRYTDATLTQGSNGTYWSSSPSGMDVIDLYFNSGSVGPAYNYNRAGGLSVRCLKENSIVLSTVTTQSTTSITATTATGNGNITATGGENPTRYIEWGTVSGTYTNSCSAGTGGTGAYSCSMTNLTPSTTYYVRAKATNSDGTSYGEEISFATAAFICGTTTVSRDSLTYGTVVGADGKCWLDRNLGATRVATAFNDTQAYGWLFQWGRGTDGHQIRTSTTTATNATTDTPGHANFITVTVSPYDWRAPQNDNLWQGVSGINNPCPAGFRLPTQAEWANWVAVAGVTNYTTAFNSSLKLTAAGTRDDTAVLINQGNNGKYWTSNPNGSYAFNLSFVSGLVSSSGASTRINGFSVRCLKDNPIITSTITTQTPTSITSTTATANGNVTATGGANPTRSIEWGTVSGNYSLGSCTVGSGGTGTFTCSMTTLSPNTTYYARAKAVNTAGTSYGSEVSFTTATLPVITITNPNTTPAQSKTITAVTNKGTLTQSTTTGTVCDNTLTFTTYASTTFSSEADNTKKICYKSDDINSGTTYTMSNAISGIDTTNPTINSVTSNCQNVTDPNFIISATDISGLASSPYSFDGGATWQSQNSKTFYDFNHTIDANNIQVKDNAGNVASYAEPITQICLAAATVTTEPTTDITLNTATLNGNITNVGSSNPERQIEWGTQTNTYPNSCTTGTGTTGTYSCNLTNLLPDTTYYYRAKATNSAGTSYGTEQSFQTLPDYITITDPTPVKMSNAVSSGQVTLNSGTASSTPLVTTNTNIHIQDTVVRMVIPQNTQITNTDSGNFNFQNFIAENAINTVKQTIPNSLSAVKVGVPNTKLTFSQPITLTIDVSPAYNGRTLDVLYQNDGESTWHSQTSCTIANGKCIFQTNHATTYTVNGSGNMVGDTGINLNTDIQEVISLDCGTSIVNMGNLTPGTPVTGSSTCLTTTNANGGYNLSVQRDDSTDTTMDKTTEDSTNITDKTPWNPTTPNAQTWSGTGLGFTVYDSTANKNTTWWGTGNSINDSNNLYAGFSPTQTDIMRYTNYSGTGTTTSIGYKLDVPPSQKSGSYSGAITYQVTTTP